jgi:hypothetical protein
MHLAFLLLQAAAATPAPSPDHPITYGGPGITFWAAIIALGFLGGLGLAILYLVLKPNPPRIDLSSLVSEPTGEASMSRFQLLVFTFVIAASFFLLVVKKGDFPEVTNGVLVLLGISASSYLVSKGIQASSPEGLSGAGPHLTIHGDRSSTSAGGPPIQFQADVVGLTNQAVTWSLDPPTGMGNIDPDKGLYTPPGLASPNPTGKVTIKAASKEDASVKDTETIDLV